MITIARKTATQLWDLALANPQQQLCGFFDIQHNEIQILAHALGPQQESWSPKKSVGTGYFQSFPSVVPLPTPDDFPPYTMLVALDFETKGVIALRCFQCIHGRVLEVPLHLSSE